MQPVGDFVMLCASSMLRESEQFNVETDKFRNHLIVLHEGQAFLAGSNGNFVGKQKEFLTAG